MLSRILFRRHLDEDEVLLKVVHKHWLIGLKALFWPMLFLALSWALVVLNPVRPLIMTVSLVSIVLVVWWLRNFFDYYLDAWLITNEGIIDIAWHGWFHRQSTRVLYSDLQGVSYEIKGVLSTLLRFGTLSVEKISTGSTISLEYVKNPRKIESIILMYQEKYLHKKNLKDSKQIHELLASMVAEQMQLKELTSTKTK